MTDYTKLVEDLRDIKKTMFALGTSPINMDNVSIRLAYDKRWGPTANDAADAIEALRFELDCVNDSIKQLALPVDGKWVRVEDGDSWHYECSRCRERPLYSLYGDIVLSGTCPFCGAKMEVQDETKI